jgi:hypothetical protein
MQKRLTTAQKDQIASLSRRGWPTRAIAETICASANTVRMAQRRAGLPTTRAEHLSPQQKARITALTKRGWPGLMIAEAVRVSLSTVRKMQKRAGLPTKRGTVDTAAVLALAESKTVEELAQYFCRPADTIMLILRKAERQKEQAAKEKREEQFMAAVRRRDGSVADLRARFGIERARAYVLAHRVWPGKFKRATAGEVPCEQLRSQPEPRPRVVPDVYRYIVADFLNRFAEAKLPLPENDLALVTLLAKHIPADVSDFERAEIVLGLTVAIRELRYESASPWIH